MAAPFETNSESRHSSNGVAVLITGNGVEWIDYSSGFNSPFYKENACMLFGDAKDSVDGMLSA